MQYWLYLQEETLSHGQYRLNISVNIYIQSNCVNFAREVIICTNINAHKTFLGRCLLAIHIRVNSEHKRVIIPTQ